MCVDVGDFVDCGFGLIECCVDGVGCFLVFGIGCGDVVVVVCDFFVGDFGVDVCVLCEGVFFGFEYECCCFFVYDEVVVVYVVGV